MGAASLATIDGIGAEGRAPGWARAAVGVLSAVLLLTATGEGVVSVARAPANWSTLGFAVVTALASVFGLLFASGKVRGSPGMTMACVAGAVLVCTELAGLGMDRWIVPLSKASWLMARRLIVLALLAITVVVALSGSRPGWRSLAVSGASAIPLALLGVWYKRAGLSPLLTPTTGVGEMLRLSGLIAAAALSLGSLCAVIHYGIRAFELASQGRGAGGPTH